VVDVLCEAFRDYPVMRFVLGQDDGPDRAERLRQLVHFFVMARALRGEPLLGIREGDELVAAAIMSFPDGGASPPELAALRDALWHRLGPEARSRYERCGEVWQELGVTVPHVHLNMIGVRRGHQGRGLARRLLEEAQEISRSTSGSQGVTLTTEDTRNVSVYEHVGYHVVGHARIAPELETWAMFRPG
jgi:GNAT superfamily N-acetyltransferase